jgi:hypothetical protein
MSNDTTQTLKQKRNAIMQMWSEWCNEMLPHCRSVRLKAALVMVLDRLPYFESLYDDSHLEIARVYLVCIQNEMREMEPNAGLIFDYIRELKEFIDAASNVTAMTLAEKYPTQMKNSAEVYTLLNNDMPRTLT